MVPDDSTPTAWLARQPVTRRLGIQTRLRLTPAQDALLADTLGIMATLARTAYQRVATGKLAADRKAVYAWATGKGLTAHQANSLATQVEQWRATDQATLKYRLESVRLRIDALERTVKSLDARLHAPSKKAKTFLSPTARARLTAIRFQKHRSLVNLRVTLASWKHNRPPGSSIGCLAVAACCLNANAWTHPIRLGRKRPGARNGNASARDASLSSGMHVIPRATKARRSVSRPRSRTAPPCPPARPPCTCA